MSLDKSFVNPHDTAENLQKKAIGLVVDYYNSYVADIRRGGSNEIAADEVFVVWFCKTLQNWKALLASHRPDNKYYELTYDGDKSCVYIDQYEKVDNFTVSFGDTTVDRAEASIDNSGKTRLPEIFQNLVPAGPDRFA